MTGPLRHARLRGKARLVPVALVGAVAFAVGVGVGADTSDEERRLVVRYLGAWERGDHARMHAVLTREAAERTPLRAFARAHRDASATATLTALRAGVPREAGDGRWRVPVVARTRVFGELRADLTLQVAGEGEEARVAWGRRLVFPGLRDGERLQRTTRLPERADLLARDGTPLAAGPRRTTDLEAASAVVGQLGTPPPERRAELRALGLPSAGVRVGLTGLERVFDVELAGRPGGELLAGSRLLARTAPRPARPVRTAIDPDVQEAAVSALGGRLGGIVAVRPRSGEVVAAAGIGWSGLQPPGSTFKIVTLAGALEARVVRPSDRFAVATSATLEGVELQNANGESCGGSLADSFAHSCNSVFGPLGAKLGAERLVRTAERFGFNRPPGIPGAATSTIPAPEDLGDDLGVGSSAIGQGKLQASALQMSWIAATIANRGRRPRLSLRAGARPRSTPVVSPQVARTVGRMMTGVVRYGTGEAAAIEGVRVAGKTGTAELRSTQGPCAPAPAPAPGRPAAPAGGCPPVGDTTDTSAWFAAYAPYRDPEIAVGVLLVEAGAGGATAAPAAKEVLTAGLDAGR